MTGQPGLSLDCLHEKPVVSCDCRLGIPDICWLTYGRLGGCVLFLSSFNALWKTALSLLPRAARRGGLCVKFLVGPFRHPVHVNDVLRVRFPLIVSMIVKHCVPVHSGVLYGWLGWTSHCKGTCVLLTLRCVTDACRAWICLGALCFEGPTRVAKRVIFLESSHTLHLHVHVPEKVTCQQQRFGLRTPLSEVCHVPGRGFFTRRAPRAAGLAQGLGDLPAVPCLCRRMAEPEEAYEGLWGSREA